MSYALIFHHDPTYGFFFGLVLVSALSPWMLITKKSAGTIIACAIAIIGIIAVSQLASPDDLIRKAEARQQASVQMEQHAVSERTNMTITNHLYYFVCGAVSIYAMILPGISGSFVLLLMGGYFDILRALSTFNVPVLFSFALGCVVGLLAFVRFLHFLLERYYNPTMGFLLGLVIGSLWVIWPFKHSVMVGTERVYLANMLPISFGANEAATLVACIIGAAIVAAMLMIERKRGKE
jgi:putative membrane protein